ncbi:putative glycolipid-binding domain-containing protein [Bacillus carboniphilus]|uniref:Glycolipid-binding domain-containing protein n=1 Tax=Bacillus carboniphilus TaxID=86663 RepID=A0ABY9JRM7_9BACI|nr:putative glycolipid-binding domain-containing protein [Bacillus carboniphilus]WLR42066.1 putative glycolipid-binding domain-containing protein [Bacillus carboniphilus]
MNVFWENKEDIGAELLTIDYQKATIVSESLVLLAKTGASYKRSYLLVLGKDWCTRKVEVYDQENNENICLHSNRVGNWFQGDSHLKQLDGAIDVDISITPFSNSLPINRLKWVKDQTRTLEMVYINALSFEVEKIEQQYTYLGEFSEGRKFQYRCRDYNTVITVDDHGLVLQYPGVFNRKL